MSRRNYTYTPLHGDQITCVLTSKVLCGTGSPATSNVITMTVTGTCGNSFTISHTAGVVAPVFKTVTYGTVTNIPGEPAKCWITRNLGASQQATAVDDATEASAGWYWQFNRKQGYKHDGSTLTPAWNNTSINENSDWLTPAWCSLPPACPKASMVCCTTGVTSALNGAVPRISHPTDGACTSEVTTAM